MTVVFEIRSPNDGADLMQQKLEFYSTHGVEEYYDFDPNRYRLRPYLRTGDDLGSVRLRGKKYTSRRLGVHFDLNGPEMAVTYPDGTPFRTLAESTELREAAETRAQEEARLRRAAETRANQAEQFANRFAELTRKARRGQATEADLEEFVRLVGEE